VNSVIIISDPRPTATGYSFKSITLETLQTRSTFIVVVTVSLTQLERSSWSPSDAVKFWVDTVILTTDSCSTAAGYSLKSITLEAL
jgi:hypothetical protein